MNTENNNNQPEESDFQDDLLDSLLNQITEQDQAASDDRMQMALKIYNRMKLLGLTQTQFAEMTGKQVSVISKWLSGTHNFTMETLTLISRVLNITLLDLEEGQPLHRMELIVKGDPSMSSYDLESIIASAGGMALTSQTYHLQS